MRGHGALLLLVLLEGLVVAGHLVAPLTAPESASVLERVSKQATHPARSLLQDTVELAGDTTSEDPDSQGDTSITQQDTASQEPQDEEPSQSKSHNDCSDSTKPFKSSTECVAQCSSGAAPNENGFCTACDTGKYADHMDHSCVSTCPPGSIKKDETSDCHVCNDASGLWLFADHAGKECVATCPAGSVKHTIDRDADGAPELFDCRVCVEEAGEQTFADHFGKRCVASCPAGSVQNGFTKDCDVCAEAEDGAQQYSDRSANECVDKCPVGSVINEETTDCINCLEGEFADHASKTCVEYAGGCPVGTQGVTAEQEPGDCNNICRELLKTLYDAAASGDPENVCSGLDCCVSECTGAREADVNDVCQA